eukprot:TRINITY_DN1871_c0_g1_i15.p1 TRINITY_DN1871_c0_g1~~TRINITY_DN1871_c0_g1_i15.p1  ORF type:complete len:332 (+),score=37.20 TRINITY_DN1871_c0_g1_i15:239-1234(+)
MWSELCSRVQFTRQIFDKVAHSSIMKLNETSMNKLFDLMIMGLKYQVIASKSPQEIYQITLNHINNVTAMVDEQDVIKLLEVAKKTLISKYSKFTMFDYIILRQELLGFLQDRHVRVSLLMQEQFQNNDGSMVISTDGRGGPCVGKPGLVRYLSEETGATESTIQIPLRATDDFVEDFGADLMAITTSLGDNLYSERNKREKGQVLTEKLHQVHEKVSSLKLDSQAVKNELNMLANIIKGDQRPEVDNSVRLNFSSGARRFFQKENQSAETVSSDFIVIDSQDAQANIRKDLADILDFKLEETSSKKTKVGRRGFTRSHGFSQLIQIFAQS